MVRKQFALPSISLTSRAMIPVRMQMILAKL